MNFTLRISYRGHASHSVAVLSASKPAFKPVDYDRVVAVYDIQTDREASSVVGRRRRRSDDPASTLPHTVHRVQLANRPRAPSDEPRNEIILRAAVVSSSARQSRFGPDYRTGHWPARRE